MPKFIDYHSNMPNLPPEAVKEMAAHAKAGHRDEFGVKAINAYFSGDGKAWCVTEADSADAVCKSHQAHGLAFDQGDVYEIKSVV
jgi:hypothetical protein